VPRSAPPRGVAARKRFGQHFLEGAWVAKLVQAIDPHPDELFVEIGPGRGALTWPLAARAAHVVACELDRDLATALEAVEHPRVTVLRGDFVDMTASTLSAALTSVTDSYVRLRAVGNLPYNVGTAMIGTLAKLHRAGLPFVDATVMLQREVADRLVAAPGTRDYGALTVLSGQWAVADRLFVVPPGAFRPAPSVQSAVVRLRYRTSAISDPTTPPSLPLDQGHFETLVKLLFGQRRKTLTKALRNISESQQLDVDAVLARTAIDGRRRPDTLTPDELMRLANATAPETPRSPF
jgi:16S rRNA (adenine1518-N6/adenine1519-N6)-dimethyltransferase